MRPRHGLCALRITRLKTSPGTTIRTLTSSANFQEDHQLKDIVAGDLKATLEAHRESNRTLRIRKIEGDGGKETEQGVQSRVIGGQEGGQEGGQDGSLATSEAQDAASPTINHTYSGLKVIKFTTGSLLGEIYRDILFTKLPPKDRLKVRTMFETIREKGFKSAPSPAIKPEEYKFGRVADMFYGQSVRAEDQFKPWESDWTRAEPNRELRLGKELTQLMRWMRLTPREHAFRQDLSVVLIDSLRRMDEDLEFWTFGSSETGLASTMSDLDIGFLIKSEEKKPGIRGGNPSLANPAYRKKLHRKLEAMLLSVLASGSYRNHELVPWAKHCLLRMKHSASNVELQIVASRPQPAAVELIKSYKDEYGQLVPIFFTVKAALACRNLDEPRTGGVGSYSLLMMIVAAFKLERITRETGPAESLRAVFKFWAGFDTVNCGVGLDPPRIFLKRADSASVKKAAKGAEDVTMLDPVMHGEQRIGIADKSVPWLMCLQDPADPKNDLGRGVYRIKDIKATFRSFKDKYVEWIVSGDIKRGHTSLLQGMLGNSMLNFRTRRERFLEWADTKSGKTEIAHFRSVSNSVFKVLTDQKNETATQQETLGNPNLTNAMEGFSLSNAMQASSSAHTTTTKASSFKPEDDFMEDYVRLSGGHVTQNIKDDTDLPPTSPTVDGDGNLPMDGTSATDDPEPDKEERQAEVEGESAHASPISVDAESTGTPLTDAEEPLQSPSGDASTEPAVVVKKIQQSFRRYKLGRKPGEPYHD